VPGRQKEVDGYPNKPEKLEKPKKREKLQSFQEKWKLFNHTGKDRTRNPERKRRTEVMPL